MMQTALKNQLLGLSDLEFFIRRICDLMTGQIATIQTITYEGYIHSASIMLYGMLEEKAGQILYLAKGQKGQASHEDCIQVCAYFGHFA